MSALLYEEDFYAWTKVQAEALRKLSARRDLPNDLDLMRVAEEIEDVGSSSFAGVRSHGTNILIHAIKIIAQSEAADSIRKWRSEMRAFHREMMSRHTRSMDQHLDILELWKRAVRAAAADLADFGQTAPIFAACPIELDDIIRDEFDVDALLHKLRAAAAETT